MKFCSLCNREYQDEVENCDLSHCVSCGSTRLFTDKTRILDPIKIIMIVGFMGIIFWALIFDKMDQILTLLFLFSMMIAWIIGDSMRVHSTHLCLDCLAKGFTPMTKITLHESKGEIEKPKTQFKKIDPAEISNLLHSKVKPKKLDFRSMLLIVGLIIGFLALAFGDTIQTSIGGIFTGI